MIDYKNNTRTELEDEANAITWETHYLACLQYVYPNSAFESGNLDGLSGEPLYDAISPYQVVGEDVVYDTKLTWLDMQAEVSSYRQDQLDRIDRVFRALDLYNWGQAMQDTGHYLDSIDQDDFIRKCEEGSEVTLAALEAADTLNSDANTFNTGVREKVKRIEVGTLCVATINYMNEQNAITGPQLSAILGDTDIQAIMQLLQTGSLNTAKAQIQAKDLTGLDPMDQSYKDKIIGIIDNYLGV